MSGQPVSAGLHPPHGHPDNTSPSTQSADKPSTSSHPPRTKPDPTAVGREEDASSRQQSAPTSASPAQLSSLKADLKSALRQYPDFPSPGILFEDILPIFTNPKLFNDLLDALQLLISQAYYGDQNKPDVIVGLESRGFLFGPSLALRLGASFVPVRKKGKLPGKTVMASYQKEYGADHFEMQADAIGKGKRVLIVDDIIATGGSAGAAGNLVQQLEGNLIGYVFLLELTFLNGRDKLPAPAHTLLTGQEG